jgi:hypothetical protein
MHVWRQSTAEEGTRGIGVEKEGVNDNSPLIEVRGTSGAEKGNGTTHASTRVRTHARMGGESWEGQHLPRAIQGRVVVLQRPVELGLSRVRREVLMHGEGIERKRKCARGRDTSSERLENTADLDQVDG